MSERAASTTAVLVCQGRAVADGRYAVGRFSDPVARELLDPAERSIVDNIRAARQPSGAGERMGHEWVRRTGLIMVPRTLAIDDAVREHAAGQIVILGAGLDARAWRMPELAAATVFEVDHPASQQDKLRRVAGRTPLAGRVVPVGMDLARDRLGPALEAAGFDPGTATTWVWEGVVPYLTAVDVAATLSQVEALCALGSRIVVNYQSRSVTALVMRRVMRVVLRLFRASDPLAGEPWRSLWTRERMHDLLNHNGFDVVSDDDLLTLTEGLTLPPESNGSLRNGRVAVAVRSDPPQGTGSTK